MDTRLVIGITLIVSTALAPVAFAADAGFVAPRRPLPKLSTEEIRIPVDRHGNVVATGRLLVKFHDSVRARTGLQPGRSLQSIAGENLRGVEDLIAAHRLTIRQAITRPVEKLQAVEARAVARTQRGQPDLAGMVYLEGPLETLLVVGRQLNEMPEVEFVEFEEEMVYHRPPAPAGDPAACGDMAAGDCFAVNLTINCDDEECCLTVGQANPFCVDEDLGGNWDIFCVNLANLLCEEGDRCKTQLVNGGCFEVHPTPGCNNETCCNLVAEIDPFCIEVEWDLTCTALASQVCPGGASNCCTPNLSAGCDTPECEALVCGVDPFCCDTLWDGLCSTAALALCSVCDPEEGFPTPDFSMTSANPANRLQKYMTPEASVPGDAYANLTGFTGHGFSIQALEDLGQTMIDDYGVGVVNGARGLGIKVGVVEHTAYVTGPKGGEEWHEDLLDVIPEPNQTIITIIGGLLDPNHGTAVLGQVVAADNGIGVTGIARDSQGYFFPIVSVQEGGRTLNAIFSALDTFEAGDILNYSIGPGGGGTLVTNAGPWTLVNLGTDLGITSVISAGNSCENVDPNAQFQGLDSGVVIVGACYPGLPLTGWPFGLGRFCRLGFSNHCIECEDANQVHVAAWGITVTTAGYGDLFALSNAAGTGINNARSYTSGFSGTSSAAPMIAGLSACLQGFAKQFYGTPLTPAGLRSILTSGPFVTPQCDSPNPPDLPGAPAGAPCAFDFDEEADARLIGGFPRAFEAGTGVITGNFFSQSPLTDVKVITGQHVAGNLQSIKAIDGAFLRVNTRKVGAGGQGAGTPPAITYMIAGETTDIEVTSATLLAPESVQGVGIQSLTATAPEFVIVAMYIYDYAETRWTFIPEFGFTGPAGLNMFGQVAFNPQNHVSPTGQLKGRVWTCGLGAVPRHQMFFDFVDLFASQVPIVGPIGP